MYMDLIQGKHFLVLLTLLMYNTVSTWKPKKKLFLISILCYRTFLWISITGDSSFTLSVVLCGSVIKYLYSTIMRLTVFASSSYFPVFGKHVTIWWQIFMVMNMSMGKDMISVRNMNTETEGIKNNLHVQTCSLTRTRTRVHPHICKHSMVDYSWLTEYQIHFIN